MSSWVRLLLGLLVAPAAPAAMLIAFAVPAGYESVLPLARLLLWYGYICALFVAMPILVVFRRRFSREPALVLPFAGVLGALAAATPFVAAVYDDGVSAADWPSFLALVPVLGIGAMFGVLSGLTLWLIAKPPRETSGGKG